MNTRKLVLEGTKEQFESLLSAYKITGRTLPDIRPEYQTHNLWQIADVKSIFPDMDDDSCMEVLEDALSSEGVMTTIWEHIRTIGTEVERENEEL